MKFPTRALFAAIAFATSFAVGAQTTLKFSHTDQQQGARHAAALQFAKSVEELTQGRYKVQVYCCSQLGNDPKNIEQLALGGIDFTVSGTGSYAPHVPTLNLTALPYLVESYAQGWKLYDESKWLQAQYDKAPAKGFRFLATWEAGFRSMTTKDPLNSPDDAKGKKLRTFPNEMMRWTLEAMGLTSRSCRCRRYISPFSKAQSRARKIRSIRFFPTSSTKSHRT